jgi:prenyltransferase beta subunit
LIDNDNNTTATNTTTTTTTPTINPLQCLSIARHIASCQTYEGGFGAESYNEAHGGYAFCAIASLHILNKLHMINSNTFLHWACSKQLSYEGGFAGRTNKLVDGCYSFWQGGAIVIMNNYLQQQCDDEEEEDELDEEDETNGPTTLFDEYMLQRYILLCAQDVNGGLRDKPSKSRDFYHSCYNLSGLSVSQHNHYTPTVVVEKKKTKEGQLPPLLVEDVVTNTRNDVGKGEEVMGGIETTATTTTMMITRQKQSINCKMFGDVKFNIVGKTDPVINIRVEYVKYMLSQEYSKSM